MLETRKFPDKFLIQLRNFYRLEVGRSWVHVEEGTEDEKRNRRDVGDVFFRGEVCMKSFLGGLGLGVTAGVLSGLVGIGGGIIIVPALVYFFKMDQKTAQGTSLAILLPPTGLLAFLECYRAGHVDVKIGAAIVVGLLLGGFFGGKFAQQLPQETLRKVFAVLLLLTAVKMWTEK